MKKLIILLSLLTGCATWAPTRDASNYRRITKQLEDCTNLFPEGAVIQRGECVDRSYTACKSSGLEMNCAEDKFESNKRRWF